MRILYKICIHVYIYIWVDMGEWRDGWMDPDILIDLDMIQLQNAVDIDVHRLMDEIEPQKEENKEHMESRKEGKKEDRTKERKKELR